MKDLLNGGNNSVVQRDTKSHVKNNTIPKKAMRCNTDVVIMLKERKILHQLAIYAEFFYRRKKRHKILGLF